MERWKVKRQNRVFYRGLRQQAKAIASSPRKVQFYPTSRYRTRSEPQHLQLGGGKKPRTVSWRTGDSTRDCSRTPSCTYKRVTYCVDVHRTSLHTLVEIDEYPRQIFGKVAATIAATPYIRASRIWSEPGTLVTCYIRNLVRPHEDVKRTSTSTGV